MRVVIVGGGVIGLSCAYELSKQGAQVTVVDEKEFGRAASWGNGGWIVPSLSGPVPAPGLIGTSARWLLQPDSPLYIKPRLDPAFVRWLLAFALRCNSRAYLAGMVAMVGLNAQTMERFDTWKAEGVPFEMHRAGLLFTFVTHEYLHHALEDFDTLEQYGYQRPPSLSRADLHDLVPLLSPEVVGGYLVENERDVEPWSLTQGLMHMLKQRGADLRPATRVIGFRRQNGSIRSLDTDHGPIEGDAFLLAAGAWSARLAGLAGFRLPVEGGKGYSITISHPQERLGVPLYLSEARVGVTPFDESLRFAGTMELSGISEGLNQRRLDSIRRNALQYLTEWPQGEGEIDWAGMRPLMPDGLPALGQAPRLENMYVATGHSMLGITLGPATGRVMADLICQGHTDVDIGPFDPGRFK